MKITENHHFESLGKALAAQLIAASRLVCEPEALVARGDALARKASFDNENPASTIRATHAPQKLVATHGWQTKTIARKFDCSGAADTEDFPFKVNNQMEPLQLVTEHGAQTKLPALNSDGVITPTDAVAVTAAKPALPTSHMKTLIQPTAKPFWQTLFCTHVLPRPNFPSTPPFLSSP